MAAEFSIPAKPEDLADEDCVLEVKICRLTALESLAAAVEGFAEGGRALTIAIVTFWCRMLHFVWCEGGQLRLTSIWVAKILGNIRSYLCRSFVRHLQSGRTMHC